MIAVVDYGVGNLYSLKCSLKHLGIECVITGNPKEIIAADKIILPGVGAFGDAVNKLHDTGLFELLKTQASKGVYMLGICLGMQLLFDKSFEYGEHEGLSLVRGEICPFAGDLKKSFKIPHMGWNCLHFKNNDDPILKYNSDGDYVYFVHSFYAKNCEKSVVADAEYDILVPAIVRNKNVYGMQFHPEKSGEKGLSLLRAFAKM